MQRSPSLDQIRTLSCWAVSTIFLWLFVTCACAVPQSEGLGTWLNTVNVKASLLAERLRSAEWMYLSNGTGLSNVTVAKSLRNFWRHVADVTREAETKDSSDVNVFMMKQLQLWKTTYSNSLETADRETEKRLQQLTLSKHVFSITDGIKASLDYDSLLTEWSLVHEGSAVYNRFLWLVNSTNYKDSDFNDDALIKMTSTLMKVYRQVHAFTREEMTKLYGIHRMPFTGHIPAHLVDGVNGVSWERMYESIRPFKYTHEELLEAKVTNVMEMFDVINDFYASLGQAGIRRNFWSNVTFTRNDTNTRQLCLQYSARGWNYRLPACLDVSKQSMRIGVELIGQLLFTREGATLPFILQEHTKDYVDEALIGALSLLFFTPAHLRTIGLLAPSSSASQREIELNFLLESALTRLSPLAWYLVVNKWQKGIFNTKTASKDWNRFWWKLRCELEGVSPPVTRSQNDIDPAVSTFVVQNIPGKRMVQSLVTQFQIAKHLCAYQSTSSGPLANCNIRDSKAAGELIRYIMSQGQNLTTNEKLKLLTGSDVLDERPMLDYLQPLSTWLSSRPQTVSTMWAQPCPDPRSGKVLDDDVIREFLNRYDAEAQRVWSKYTEMVYTFETNITDYNEEQMVNASLESSQFQIDFFKQAKIFDVDNLTNSTQKRLLESVLDIGTDALGDQGKLKEFSQIESKMSKIYGTAQVCLATNTCIPLEPDLTRLMAESRNYTELTSLWKLWRDATGQKLKTYYQTFVTLGNEGVREQGWMDMGEWWRSTYEDDNFQQNVASLLKQLRPLYQQLHTYVRHRLIKFYGEERFPSTGHIPAHILGNMWAQEWTNILDIVLPYPSKINVDITDELVKQKYTVERMFKTAEEFYTSLGLSPMPDSFWNDSMLHRPTDGREVECHASAWDFLNGKDFRITMCTDITMEYLITIHHEMGHIVYDMQYQHQPVSFREGANPGFHEAIGDVISMSVTTPEHLKKIGLLTSVEEDNDTDINFLLKSALQKIAFIPFGYLIDQWRWSVFSGETTPDNYNAKWWQLRCKYQGVSPPVERSEQDFDPGAKFHVPSNTPYIRYFVSTILQFTLYSRLCQAANHTGPLHRCDLYKSTEAGQLLKEMMQKGNSEPWQDILQAFNGERSMNASAIIEYFRPLTEWLTVQNAGLTVGWTDTCPPGTTEKITDEAVAREWLQQYDTSAMNVSYEHVLSTWNYNTNITEETQKNQIEAGLKMALWQQEKAAEANRFDWRHLSDKNLVRQFRMITDIGTSAMTNVTKLKRLDYLKTINEGIYAKAKVCANASYCLDLEPGLIRFMRTSRDYDELLWAWKGWRDATGPFMKDNYAEFVSLSNEAVRKLGHADTGAYWRSWYESETFESDIRNLLQQLQPLYKNLHAYVRRKLQDVYGADRFPYSGHIPGHLLGNMWAQSWDNLYDMVTPFPNKTSVNITPELKRQGYTAEKMFSTAEEFFQSLGLKSMPLSFWQDSMLEKPKDGRDVVCHASAWDFSNKIDFRIKMCTDVTMQDLITIHHEMGHIQYYLQYNHQPIALKGGANSGFHEAIGDTLALSVSNPSHLHSIQLLPAAQEDEEATINYLMSMALKKISFLPFGYLIDQWRWSVFSGETTPEHYVDKWWELRCKYQGISSPVPRNSTDFDPGAKYHVPSNTDYIRYFVSHILQFQFYKALCNASGHEGPLHTCDFYRSKEAGQRLSNMMRLGCSVPWPQALEQLTGTRQMDAAPLLEYFQPLITWLEKENYGFPTGWTEECPQAELTDAGNWLMEYNRKLKGYLMKSAHADWNYSTNITDYNSQKSVEASVALAVFQREEALKAEHFDWRNISHNNMRRQFKKLTNIGPYAMKNSSMLQKMESIHSQMKRIYGAGKVCLDSSTKCLSLEPDLENILANNRSYDRLLHVWKGWRDVTGPVLRPLYEEFVSLSNQGVRELGYADTGEFWRSWYESETFVADIQALLQQLQPLYEQLHAYVRRRLIQTYGQDKFPDTGHIPAHLLGNMWAQEWSNIYKLVIPYPNQSAIDVTETMVKQGYTVEKMFKTAEDFFNSLGFEPLPGTFWTKSMLKKPSDGRDIICHASAWDFFDGKDFRISMCTDITMEDLITIHHEMGHVQYFMQYRLQPLVLRDGTNPGFHEAIGDTLALSVSTPGHLRKLGLLDEGEDNYLEEINFQLDKALGSLAFLPFGYLVDQWRWSVFSGETTPNQYNTKWWNLRCDYQGISPPIRRSEKDFDPGAKFHIPDNTPYISYFVAVILKFQFHQALCKAAGHTGPLHRCDIYNSTQAGRLLRNMLSKGYSESWPHVLEEMTGYRRLDAGAFLEYFRPLSDWLRRQNARERVGWSKLCPQDFQQLSFDSVVTLPNLGFNTKSGITLSITIISWIYLYL